MLEILIKRSLSQRSSITTKESLYKAPKDLLSEGPLMPGDIESYDFFSPEECKESVFCSSQYPNPKFTSTELQADDTAILNEDIFNTLFKSCMVKNEDSSTRKKLLSDEAKMGSQLKLLNESLNRITRYNNKRKYEERLGFASTLAAKAEEIGITNTINFLSKAIENYLVTNLNTIGNRRRRNKGTNAPTSISHSQIHLPETFRIPTHYQSLLTCYTKTFN